MADPTYPAESPVMRLRSRISVRVVEGPDVGLDVAVTRPVLLGSSQACDVQLSDPAVSRRHVVLAPTETGVRVRDQESRNGTWLSETRLWDAAVPPGGRIRMGDTVLLVAAEPEEGEPDRPATEARSFGRFIGEAECLRPLYAQLERAAASDVTVLLEGESGTGKELLAEGLHESGPRCERPFVIVDCGALPPALIESELFGHEKGAFTGADRRQSGAFESADGGTLFLDEIGELPLNLQTRLLRVLDRGQVRPVGSRSLVEVDVRVVAATNRDLDREVEESRFRLDLFHRLAVVTLRIPPLRDRVGDVELLARHFGARLGAANELSDEVLARMRAHRWPGNVRELRNHVARLGLLGDTSEGRALDVEAMGTVDQLARSGLPYHPARAKLLEAFTASYVDDMLARHEGNVSRAAAAAGVARRHFQRLKQKR